MKYFQYVCNYRGIFIYHVNIITKSGSLGVAYSYRTAPSPFLFDAFSLYSTQSPPLTDFFMIVTFLEWKQIQLSEVFYCMSHVI